MDDERRLMILVVYVRRPCVRSDRNSRYEWKRGTYEKRERKWNEQDSVES